jgi:hypothetical protein
MANRRYTQFCERLAACWMADDLDAVADFYSHPLAIYTGNTVRIELNRQDTIDSIAMRITSSRAAGAAKIVPELTDVSQSEDGRAILHINWQYLDSTDQVISQSVLRYYCRESQAGEIKIEMVEFEAFAYPSATGNPPKRRDH